MQNPGSASQDPIFSNNKLPAGDVGYPGAWLEGAGSVLQSPCWAL